MLELSLQVRLIWLEEAAVAERLLGAAEGRMQVTVKVSVPTLPAASLALIVMTLMPGARVMLGMDQLVVPLAEPLPPAEFDQLTEATPTVSLAVPARALEVVRVV